MDWLSECCSGRKSIAPKLVRRRNKDGGVASNGGDKSREMPFEMSS